MMPRLREVPPTTLLHETGQESTPLQSTPAVGSLNRLEPRAAATLHLKDIDGRSPRLDTLADAMLSPPQPSIRIRSVGEYRHAIDIADSTALTERLGDAAFREK